MTEITDYAKVWFSHVATCYDPATGEAVEDDTPRTILEKAQRALAGATVVVAFRVTRPEKLTWSAILQNLQGQAYVRVLLPQPDGSVAPHRVDELQADLARLEPQAHLFVAQDRLTLTPNEHGRFLEAVETALHFGQGEVHLFTPGSGNAATLRPAGHYSRGLHSPATGRTFRPASPALFSFNSPLGACPQCRGFGRVIEIDYRLAIPDRTKSIDDGAIKCWEGEVYSESKKDLLQFARKRRIPTDAPFASLTPEQQAFVIDGEPGYGTEGREWPKAWYGVKGFFRWLEKNTYKMHVRVFLSRYRAYNPCPACSGTRLQPEALCWKWRGRTLPELYQLPISELLELLKDARPERSDHQSELAYDAITARLRYLTQVGLGYLTLDRPSKTLSGGEVERVNLTSCLGTSLVDTLFVLDEPSVGLHPRDIDRLIGIVRTLTDAGNTVVVVEHDEAMIRAADHVIEIGPEAGARGGHVVFQGTVEEMVRSTASITGRYLSGREHVPVPTQRRPVTPLPRLDQQPNPTTASRADRRRTHERPPEPPTHWLTFAGASKHNLTNVSVRLPLQRLVCLSGVSGSGKSTLLDHVIYQGLLTQRHQLTDDVASIVNVTSELPLADVVLVDQSPLSRTPRSNPALYCEASDLIREL
ncbi:MAG TPA: excinuclease ABC subunit A, partial [Candidatus Synoicihabitans sp.]|nr:excinuclease ABC subunit A [Candidatus Synoicihabitans sp.]